MRRFTTPTHTIETDMDLTGARVYVTYRQNGRNVIEKTNDELTITDKTVFVHLTQQETGKFSVGNTVKVQIRYVFNDGSAGASNIMETTAEEVLKIGVIDYEGDVSDG